MKQIRIQNLLLLFCLILIISLQSFAQNKSICNETSEGAGYGSTYWEYKESKLKFIKGRAFYPNKQPIRVNIEIYQNILKKNSDEKNPKVNDVISSENLVTVCRSDEEGNFEIKGLKDGFYLLKIGNNKDDGYGPVYKFVEISKKNGKKRKLEIELGDQI